MSTKPLNLSSSGLKNVNNQKENEFSFIFGERTIKMNTFVAEFLSPSVSRLHLSDPTIDSIRYSTPIDEDIISLFENLSCGSTITVTNSQSYKLKLLSILLSNNELFPDSNLDEALKILENIVNDNEFGIDITFLINLVSKNFNSIEKNRLKKLSKSILYKIVTNEQLVIDDYDSFFDIIHAIFEEDKNINCFYERIEMTKLSENKFHQLILSLNPNEISTTLWEKICERIINKETNECKVDSQEVK